MSEPAANPEQTPEQTPEVTSDQPDFAALQAKIDALTASHSQPATPSVDQGLIDKINNIEATLAALGSQAQPASPTPGATTSLFGNVTPAVPKAPAPAADAASFASIIEQTVARAVQPLQEELRLNKQQDQLIAQQQQSFNRAVANFPDLADPNSAAAKAFNQLYDARSDITSMVPDAPELIAEISRGLVSDVVKRDAQLGRAKAQVNPASASTPNSAAPQRQSYLPQASDTEEAGKLIEELTQKGSDPTQGLDSGEMQSLIGLSIAKQVGESVEAKR
jgi:hypothetical protein